MDDLAKRQWEEWALARRHLIKAGAFALAGGALASRSGPFGIATAAARQEEPQVGGKVVMTLYTDVFSFGPQFRRTIRRSGRCSMSTTS